MHGPDGEIALSSPLPGRFNVYNVLGALAAARALGVPIDTAAVHSPRPGTTAQPRRH